mmetsp:Transcript_3141/g.4580  ORF Transcript_3141/g.4580 Transcript_3141/m.4580 type:complete len:259 (+) Transcript_3141:171-947(+)
MSSGLEVPTGGEDGYSNSKQKSSQFGSVESFLDMEKTRMFLMASASKITDRVTLDTIRPLPVFLGISGPSLCFAPNAFTPPSKKLDKNTAEKVSQRITLNFSYFLSNYAMIFIGTCIIVTLMHPAMIIYSSVVYFLWKGHKIMVENQTPLVVGGKDVGQYVTVELRTRILYIITAWVVVAYCFRPFMIVVNLTGLLVMFHAFMRDPKHIDSFNSPSSLMLPSGLGRQYGDESSLNSSSGDEGDSSGSEVVVEKIENNV